MKLKRYIRTTTCMVLLFTSMQVSAKDWTISGKIRDQKTLEPIVGATLYVEETKQGCVSNAEGYFAMVVDVDKPIKLSCRYIGYETQEILVSSTKNSFLTIDLASTSILTKEVVVKGNRVLNSLRSTQTSAHAISPKEIEYLPSLAGEKDIIKALQMLPGVTGGSEGSSDLVVRGGSPDQNLFLIDGVPIYNASHALGLFSVFTPEAVSHVDFYKGGFPAQYGERLSSVVDISMKEGNRDHFTGDISIGTISSKGLIEGPINNGRGAYIFTARRTYADLLIGPFIKTSYQDMDTSGMSDFDLYFYDLNGKITYQISPRTKLYANFYSGTDLFGSTNYEDVDRESQTMHFDYKNEVQWGNTTGSLRLNHLFSSRNYMNLSLFNTNYHYNTELSNTSVIDYKGSMKNVDQKTVNKYTSEVKDYGLRYDHSYIINPYHSMKWGVAAMKHHFTPGRTTMTTTDKSKDGVNDFKASGAEIQNTSEVNGFLQWEMTPNDKWKANLGVRYAYYHTKLKDFQSVQPRVSLRYMANDFISIKASYDRMMQPIHLLSQNNFVMGTSIWIPASKKLSPGVSQQVTLGTTMQLNPKWTLTMEAWGKKLENQVALRYGSLDSSEEFENEITCGEGKAYGLDILLRKRQGKTTGWVSYTLSRNERRFDEINSGRWYPYRYDRTHDFKMVVQHSFSKKVQFGANYIFSSGYPLSVPKSVYPTMYSNGDNYGFESSNISVIPDVNGDRMRAYHRLDCSISFNKKRKRGTRTWSFGVYNIYNRKNPYNYIIDSSSYEYPIRIQEFSIFTIIPSITYRFNFK